MSVVRCSNRSHRPSRGSATTGQSSTPRALDRGVHRVRGEIQFAANDCAHSTWTCSNKVRSRSRAHTPACGDAMSAERSTMPVAHRRTARTSGRPAAPSPPAPAGAVGHWLALPKRLDRLWRLPLPAKSSPPSVRRDVPGPTQKNAAFIARFMRGSWQHLRRQDALHPHGAPGPLGAQLVRLPDHRRDRHAVHRVCPSALVSAEGLIGGLDPMWQCPPMPPPDCPDGRRTWRGGLNG